VVERPAHGVTVGDVATGADAVQMVALLDSGVPLARKLRERAKRVVARTPSGTPQAGTQQ
jgi:hypothetical protein